MAQQVVTELVIDSDTSGADKFSQAMAGAEQAASRGLDSVTGFNAGVVALGTGMVAAGVAAKGMLDYVVSANKGLADMQTIAHQVGLTLTDFQGIQFGGAINGLSTEKINAGLEKSAALLNDASRNSNSLSKELEANSISVKNANGQLITENQLLGIAANLIKNAANPGDQLAIAQMLGFTKEWIPLLEQGEGVMSGLAAEAKAAGAVIDDETIKKATEFDSEWRKSTVIFAATLKAAIADALPYIDDLIMKAKEFIDEMKKARPSGGAPNPFLDENSLVDRTFRNAVRGGLNAVGINPDAGIEIKLAPEVTQGWSNFTGVLQQKFNDLQNNASDDMKKRIEDLDAWWHNKALDPAFVANAVPRMLSMASGGAFPSEPVTVSRRSADEMKWSVGSGSSITDTSGAQNSAAWLGQSASLKAVQDSLSGVKFGPVSKVAAKDTDDANDSVDRAINTLKRHTAQQEADTAAVGLGAGALAQFRAEASLKAAVVANDNKVTAEQKAQFDAVAKAAGDAAVALAKAKVAGDIQFGQRTAFLSQEDVAIAQQLKGIYGNDIPAALASTEASALKTNAAMRSLTTAVEGNLVTGLTDIVSGTKSVSQGFSDMAKSVLQSLEQMLIKFYIVTPIFQAFQASLGGGLGSLLGGGAAAAALPLPGAGNFIGPVASARGNIFDGGNVIPFARGGIVGGPTMAPMALMGEAGPEAIVPLRRGADGNLGIASSGSGGGGNVEIHYHNAPQVAQQTEQQRSNGRRIDVVFADAVAGAASTPKVRQSLAGGGLVRR